METRVRDKYNMIIGYIRGDDNRQTGIHVRKGYCGYYLKSADLTFDKNGQVYCYGNGLDSLIREANK